MSWIARARRHRLAIGFIVAYALLLGAVLPAFAAVDPLQAYFSGHLCGPGETSGDGKGPAAPADHQHDCQLCGPACAMACGIPAAILADAVVSAGPFAAALEARGRRDPGFHAPFSRYPSDILSQGPPQAV